MAGGWGHIVADDEGGDHRYAGTSLLDMNTGDWTEAVEQLYGMIMRLTGGEEDRIADARDHWLIALQAHDARARGTATAPLGGQLIDPDCTAGKCGSCVGDPCEHHCHARAAAAVRDDRR